MEVSGTVLAAADLEPVKGMMVGLHVDLDDSAFAKNRSIVFLVQTVVGVSLFVV